MALQANDKSKLRMEAIRAMRGELADRTAELKIRAIWKLGDLISNAANGDDEDVMRRLRMLEEEEADPDPYAYEEEEGEEEKEDEAAKWLRQEEENIQQQEQRKKLEQERQRRTKLPPMEKGQEEGEWQSPAYGSERFGSVVLASPSENGTWPDDPGPAPSFFPLSENDVKNIEAVRAVFQKPETWDQLEEVAKDPTTAHSIQQWLVPKIVLAVGRRWWQANKNRRQLGSGVPFGLFDSDYYFAHQKSIDTSAQGRSWILQINRLVTMYLARYLATKGPGPQEKIDGYISSSLYRHATKLAAMEHGFELKKEPQCAYCQFKTTTPGMPPSILQPMVPPAGARTKLTFLRCRNCEDDVEVQENIARERGEEVSEAQKRVEWLRGQIKDLRSRGADESEWGGYYRELMDLNSSMSEKRRLHQDAEGELDIRRRLVTIPRTHIICISDTCPGRRIPLTFVDWTNPFWETPDGKEARDKLSSWYGVSEFGRREQDASDDEADPWSDVPKGSDIRPPPEWMWNIPFFCPYEMSEGVKFTSVEARGKGPMSRNSGKRLGGMLADALRATMWRKPFQPVYVGTRGKDEGVVAPSNTIDEIKMQTGLEVDVDSGRVEEERHQHLHQKELEARLGPYVSQLRQAFEARKDQHTSLTGGAGHKTNRKIVLKHYLYEAIINWSHDNELYFAGWISGRSPKVRKKIDRRTGQEVGVIEFLALERAEATKVKTAIMQAWIKEVLKRDDGFDLLTASGGWSRRQGKSWLTSEKKDGVPARAYFIAPVKQFNNEVFMVPCGLKYGKEPPLGLGKSSPRGSSYRSPRIAFVEGVWDYRDATTGSEQHGMPVPVEDGDAVTAQLRNLNALMDSADHRSVYLRQADLGLVEGDLVIVKALFMPGQGGWMPLKEIDKMWKEHRKDAEEGKPQ